MECKQEQNLARCTCPSTTCSRRGLCCDCLANHLSNRSFPACVFPPELAKDRSFESFARLVTAGQL